MTDSTPESAPGSMPPKNTMLDARDPETALRSSEERFRALIENSSDVFVILGADAVVAYTSPSMERILGHRPGDRIGRSGFELIHPDDRHSVDAMFREAIAHPGVTVQTEFRYLHGDGRWRIVEAAGRNLIDHPAVGGAVVTLRDITERRAAERQLHRAERLSAIGRLAGTIAHEFNNVLMSIQPFAELIERISSDERVIHPAVQIARAVRRGKRVTHDILRFTQMVEPELMPVDLSAWLKSALDEISTLIGKNVAVDCDTPAEPVSVMADASQLLQLLTNLVLNASDAMPHGGRVRVRLWQPDGDSHSFGVVPKSADHVVLTVTDEGHGIPAEHLSHVFEPLFTTKPSGTGLGLAVAHQIVSAHGGHIFAETKPGAGASFHIFLRKPMRLVGATESSRPTSILLVEDEAPIAEGVAALLSLDGFAVSIAPSGAAAMKLLRSTAIDAVVLDVGLPDIDGTELYNTIQAERPSLPVVFSTGHADASCAGALASDRVRFLRKPYAYDELLAVIREILAAGGSTNRWQVVASGGSKASLATGRSIVP